MESSGFSERVPPGVTYLNGSVHGRPYTRNFAKWRALGAYDRILEALHIRLDADGTVDWGLWCIDGSSVRASRAAAGASKKAACGTRKSRKTTLWAAHEADSAASSTWLLTVGACR